MEKVLSHFGLSCEWILDCDAPELTDEIIEKYYKRDDAKALNMVIPLWGGGSEHVARRLNDCEISLAIKHTIAMQKIANGNENFALVLEDDCIFAENFNELFREYLQKTPSDWDIIHVGNGYGMAPEKYVSSHSNVAYKMMHPASRCAEAIFVKKEAAAKISSTMKPICLAADWWLACQYWLHNLNVYWWEPAIVTQGSHAGIFKSSLR
jgi:glycosyl transferase family 25